MRGKAGSWEHGTKSGYEHCRKEPGGACGDCRGAARDAASERRAEVGQSGRRMRHVEAPKFPAVYANGDTLEELLEAW